MNEKSRNRGFINWKCVFFSFILAANLLSLSQPVAVRAQDTTVSPDRIEETLIIGQCADEKVIVNIGAAPIPKLDVALVIDVTGSMREVIDQVTSSASEIVADIRALVPDAAFALGTLADYPNIGGDVGDYPWQVEQDFTDEEKKLQQALDAVKLHSGGDGPESYLRALSETRSLGWREGSRRVVILFGDSTPHDPDPGKDATPGTEDDLTLEKIINQMEKNNITVLGVYSRPPVRPFYETISKESGGQAFGLDASEQIPEAVRTLVEETVTLIRVLTLLPASPGDIWLQWLPEKHTDVEPLQTREFSTKLCIPAGTIGGDYPFDLEVTGDGATVGKISVFIHVLIPTPTPTPTPLPTAVPTPTPTSTPLPTAVPTPVQFISDIVDKFDGWLFLFLLIPLLLFLLWWWWGHRPKQPGRVDRPTPRAGSVSMPGRGAEKPAPRKEGQSITHGRIPPKKR
jgi:hypothetical protein